MILSENHLMIREMARQFAEKELTREVPGPEAEATNSFRKPFWTTWSRRG